MSPRSSSAFWRSKRVLVTAGPTREPIDPIRFISNASSGKFGMAIAAAAHARGAKVTVVLGPCGARAQKGIRVAPVVTAEEMRRAVMALLPRADVLIGAAAVGDWKAAVPARRKIKRKPGLFHLALLPNADIIKEAAARRGKRAAPIIAGFALETDHELANARRKLADKKIDLIVANGPETLGSSRARLAIVSRLGFLKRYAPRSKRAAAAAILSAIERFSRESDARRTA